MTDEISQDQKNHILNRIPMGRFGQIQEVATIVAFLLNDEESSYLTGQTIGVNGGLLM